MPCLILLLAFHKGKLASLLPERDGPLIVTRGRLGEKSLERLLGVAALPVLMPSSRVAQLFMWRAHLGYSGLFHRSVAQTLAKCRSSVWIVKAKDLAKEGLLGVHGVCQEQEETGKSADGFVERGVPSVLPSMDQHST